MGECYPDPKEWPWKTLQGRLRGCCQVGARCGCEMGKSGRRADQREGAGGRRHGLMPPAGMAWHGCPAQCPVPSAQCPVPSAHNTHTVLMLESSVGDWLRHRATGKLRVGDRKTWCGDLDGRHVEMRCERG
jgi:hypothetical protein